jgi:hypothetical protein
VAFFFHRKQKKKDPIPKKRFEKRTDMTVILIEVLIYKVLTGTAMASPHCESPMDGYMLLFYLTISNLSIIFFPGTKQGLIHHHYTFSFAYTLS